MPVRETTGNKHCIYGAPLRTNEQMPFNLNFSAQTTELSQLKLEVGEILFVLGANGTGKSYLMHHFAQQNREQIRMISAHRQTWMNTDTLDMTPSVKVQTEQNIKSEDQRQRAYSGEDEHRFWGNVNT